MEFFRIKKDIPFMRHALAFNIISLVTFLLAVFFLFHRGLHLSVEFTGGTLIERNLLQRIGVEPGHAGSGTWRQAGVILGNAKNDIMRLNRLVDIGYCGVIAGARG